MNLVTPQSLFRLGFPTQLIQSLKASKEEILVFYLKLGNIANLVNVANGHIFCGDFGSRLN